MFGQPSRGAASMASRTGFGAKSEGGLLSSGDDSRSRRKRDDAQGDGSARQKSGKARDTSNSRPRGAPTGPQGGGPSKRGRLPRQGRPGDRSNPDVEYRPSSSSSSSTVQSNTPLHNGVLGEVDHPKTDTMYAQRIYDQLRKDGVRAPAWPANPGNPKSKAALAQFKEQYKTYRDRARASLIKANLIDDPEESKKLEDAIDFKGICEDMCTDWEKITRITEFDVKQAERDPETGWPMLEWFVKKLARSAAGQEAPLPMDIRSVATLRRTINYLVDDLLLTDADLPPLHGFLWDRTRAIRRDFAFFSAPNLEELLDQVYCLETIARFHVTSLHMLSRANNAPDDYSEHQEVEQLGNALMSLRYAYDDCRAQGHECPNEAEFRAYEIILKANQPNILEITQRESAEFWLTSNEVQTAVSLVEALHSTYTFHGPLTRAPATAGEGNHHTYFRIVEREDISYTMACFAEIHFAQLRRSILEAVKKAYSRPRGSTRDITATVLNEQLRFDTVQEAIACAEKLGLQFEPGDSNPLSDDDQVLVLDGSTIAHVRLSHQYSTRFVESKRGGRSISELIHGVAISDGSADGLFVQQPAPQQPLFRSAIAAAKPLGQLASSLNSFKAAPAPATNPFAAQINNTSTPSTFFPTQATQTATTTAPNPFQNPFAGAAPPQQPLPILPAQSTQAPQPSTNPFAKATAPAPPAPPSEPPKNPFAFFSLGTGTSTTTPTQVANVLMPSTKPVTPIGSVLSSTPAPFSSTTKRPTFFSSVVQPSATASPSNTPQAPPTSTTTTTPALAFAFQSPAPAPTSASEPPSVKLIPPTPDMASSASVPPTNLAFPGGSNFPSIRDTFITPYAPVAQTTTTPSGGTSRAPSILGLSVTPNGPSAISQSTAPNTLAQAPSTPQPSPLSAMTSVPTLPALMPRMPVEDEPMQEEPITKDEFFSKFSNWFVNGDGGLMTEFETYIIREIVIATFNKYQEDEEQRIAHEAHQKLLDEAIKFRHYKISRKYLALWRHNARAQSLRRLRHTGRDQLRAYNEAKRKADERKKRSEKAIHQIALASRPDAVDEFRKLIVTPGSFRSSFRSSTSRQQEEEDLLLATGVLSGIPNEREVASQVVGSRSPESDWLRDSMGPPPLPAKRQNGDTDAASVVSSTPPATKSISIKSRRLIEQYGTDAMRRSLPPLELGHNFAEFDSPRSEKKPRRVNLLSERWRLKTMGIETGVDGSLVVPGPVRASSITHGTNWDEFDERKQRRQGEYVNGFRHSVSRRESDANGFRRSTSLRSSPASSVVSLASLLDNNNHNVPSTAPSIAKRKRPSEDDEFTSTSPDLAGAKRRGISGITGAATVGPTTTTTTSVLASSTQAQINEAQKLREEMRRMREEMEEGVSWFREQSQIMQTEGSSRGGSVY